MAFSPAELVEEVRNEVLALKGGWAQVRMSHVLQVHDLPYEQQLSPPTQPSASLYVSCMPW